MVEIGLMPKIIVKRVLYEKMCPAFKDRNSLSCDDNLVTFGYFSMEDADNASEKLKEKGLKIGTDYTITEMGDILHPVDWLCRSDETNPMAVEYQEGQIQKPPAESQ